VVTHPADSDQPPPAPAPEAPEPLLRVVRGDATAEEIAALVAVLMSVRSGGGDAPPEPVPSAWSARPVRLRRPVFPGPSAWRRSALPG
jgi:hypothetical protein